MVLIFILHQTLEALAPYSIEKGLVQEKSMFSKPILTTGKLSKKAISEIQSLQYISYFDSNPYRILMTEVGPLKPSQIC